MSSAPRRIQNDHYSGSRTPHTLGVDCMLIMMSGSNSETESCTLTSFCPVVSGTRVSSQVGIGAEQVTERTRADLHISII